MGKVIARFRQTMKTLQTAWSIAGITLLFLLFLETALRLTFALRDRLSTLESPDPRILAEGYGGATWPINHYQEIELLEERWQPYVYFRPKPFNGKTIAIGPDGLRYTWQPDKALRDATGKKPVKILALGGSSLWGFGAGTIKRSLLGSPANFMSAGSRLRSRTSRSWGTSAPRS